MLFQLHHACVTLVGGPPGGWAAYLYPCLAWLFQLLVAGGCGLLQLSTLSRWIYTGTVLTLHGAFIILPHTITFSQLFWEAIRSFICSILPIFCI